eukprot:6093600-Amphidinium_carterae.1
MVGRLIMRCKIGYTSAHLPSRVELELHCLGGWVEWKNAVFLWINAQGWLHAKKSKDAYIAKSLTASILAPVRLGALLHRSSSLQLELLKGRSFAMYVIKSQDNNSDDAGDDDDKPFHEPQYLTESPSISSAC